MPKTPYFAVAAFTILGAGGAAAQELTGPDAGAAIFSPTALASDAGVGAGGGTLVSSLLTAATTDTTDTTSTTSTTSE